VAVACSDSGAVHVPVALVLWNSGAPSKAGIRGSVGNHIKKHIILTSKIKIELYEMWQ
jgi:hypothetical protein